MRWIDLVERLKRATGLTDRQVEGIASMEKRRAFRVTRHIALVGHREGGEKVNMLAVEFGATGLRAESPVRLHRDEVLKLTLEHGKAHRTSVDVDDDAPYARVVWIRKRKTLPTHDVGLIFVVDTPMQRRAAAHFVLDDCKVGIRDPRESRRLPRVRAEMAAHMMTTDGTSTQVKVCDIALGGALLDSPRQLERGTEVDLKVFLPTTDRSLFCQGKVVRCAQLGTRTYQLGVAFTTVSDDHKERLIACLSELMRGAAAE